MKWLFVILPLLMSCDSPIDPNDGIDLKEANVLARKAQENTSFPIVINDQVLKYLNHFMARPGGRLHLKDCFLRMKKYEKQISGQIKKQNLPIELMAIPVIESGYQNIHSKRQTGSGLWQLISSTAKAKGLKINKSTDERLHIERSTKVALQCLKSNYKMLRDWQLAILAYNVGENKVKRGVLARKSRNAWTLIESGYEGDEGYLAKVMAVIIIMKNLQIIS